MTKVLITAMAFAFISGCAASAGSTATEGKLSSTPTGVIAAVKSAADSGWGKEPWNVSCFQDASSGYKCHLSQIILPDSLPSGTTYTNDVTVDALPFPDGTVQTTVIVSCVDLDGEKSCKGPSDQ